jgi:putative sigma-54 modulation protein
MQINIETMPRVFNPELKPLTIRKVERLAKFYDHIIEADVYMKEDADPKHPAIVQLRLNVPQDTLFCEERGSSFEEAVDKASNAMERQVKKFKEKLRPHV